MNHEQASEAAEGLLVDYAWHHAGASRHESEHSNEQHVDVADGAQVHGVAVAAARGTVMSAVGVHGVRARDAVGAGPDGKSEPTSGGVCPRQHHDQPHDQYILWTKKHGADA